MELNNMKNIVVLKNLPSNIIEEAIVILKSNKNAKKFEYIENSAKGNCMENTKEKNYIVKEAEYVISNYISKVENIKNKKSQKTKKVKMLQLYTIITSVLIVIALVKMFI